MAVEKKPKRNKAERVNSPEVEALFEHVQDCLACALHAEIRKATDVESGTPFRYLVGRLCPAGEGLRTRCALAAFQPYP